MKKPGQKTRQLKTLVRPILPLRAVELVDVRGGFRMDVPGWPVDAITATDAR